MEKGEYEHADYLYGEEGEDWFLNVPAPTDFKKQSLFFHKWDRVCTSILERPDQNMLKDYEGLIY